MRTIFRKSFSRWFANRYTSRGEGGGGLEKAYVKVFEEGHEGVFIGVFEEVSEEHYKKLFKDFSKATYIFLM